MAASWTAFPNLVICKLKQNVHLQLGTEKEVRCWWLLGTGAVCFKKHSLFRWYFSNTREAFKELRKSENVKSSGK